MTTDPELYPVPSEWAQRARMTKAGYETARVAARETPDAFWSEQARRVDWMSAPPARTGAFRRPARPLAVSGRFDMVRACLPAAKPIPPA